MTYHRTMSSKCWKCCTSDEYDRLIGNIDNTENVGNTNNINNIDNTNIDNININNISITDNIADNVGSITTFITCKNCYATEHAIKERVSCPSNGIQIACTVTASEWHRHIFVNHDSTIRLCKNRLTYHYSTCECMYTSIGRLVRRVVHDMLSYIRMDICNGDRIVSDRLLACLGDSEMANCRYASSDSTDMLVCSDSSSTGSASLFDGMSRHEVAMINTYNLKEMLSDRTCTLLVIDMEGASRVFGNEGYRDRHDCNDIARLSSDSIVHTWI